MLRRACVFIIFAALLLGSVLGYAEGQEIRVLVDGLPVSFDVPPIIRDHRTLVPFRFIAEALRVDVEWDGTTRTVTAWDNKTKVILRIGTNVAYINERSYFLDTAPIIIAGRTLIPARFFAEAFACGVDWDQAVRSVLITSPPKSMAVLGFYALGDSQTSSWTDLFGTPFPLLGKGNTDIVSDLGLGWYTVDQQGNLLTQSNRTAWRRPSGWQNVLTAAYNFGLATEMTVHETNNGSLLTSLLNNPEAVNRLVAQIVTEAQYYRSVNLDLESLGLSEKGEALLTVRQRFTSFVALLATELKATGKTLTLTLHPPNSAYQGYDYLALGRVADRIVIMAYDYGPKPEPINRVVKAVEMALEHVPPEKLMLGISLASENAESIQVKIGIAKRYGLCGIALWRLGLTGETTWQAIRSSVKPR